MRNALPERIVPISTGLDGCWDQDSVGRAWVPAVCARWSASLWALAGGRMS